MDSHEWSNGASSAIGPKREAVTRVMSELRETGAIEVVDRRIYLRDHEALEQVAEARPAARSLPS